MRAPPHPFHRLRTRFSPFRDAKGHCVPSLYAGSTVESAIYETVFHDIPLSADRKTVPRDAVEKRNHSALLVRRDLRLASLRAQAIHTQFDDVEGLVWTSNLCDPDSALLLFGDRVAVADIQVVAVREGTDGSFLRDVRNAGGRGGIQISL